MCTSLISNRKKTIVGWNLDLLKMEYRIRKNSDGVFIEIDDATEGWMPLFGANNRGEFVGMPTCWPFDERSNPSGGEENVILLDIDLLTKKKTFKEIKEIVETRKVASNPGFTFMSQLTDSEGNVLQIVPGQGYQYFEKPKYKVLTNFSPYKGNSETHPFMGYDRYEIATKMLEGASDDFDVKDCFEILKATAQDVCPTVVSMVYDVRERTVYWCEKQNWADIQMQKF